MGIRGIPGLAIGLLALGGALSAVEAAPLSVDGNLADWNVVVQDWIGACGTNNPASCHSSNFAGVVSVQGYAGSFHEDTNDKSNDYVVGPNSGGQNYDVEFMAAAIQGGKLYLAISSGIRPDNGSQLFGPGDIRITIDGVTKIGIEVGGGAPLNAGGAIDETANGTTYALNGSGFTTGSIDSATQTAGSIWTGVTWLADPIDGSDETQFTVNGGSTLLGIADYVFTRNASTAQHSFIELSFDLALLPDLLMGVSVLEIQWGPGCGNDVGLIVLTTPQGDVPAPAALPLFLLGLAGLGVLRRRRAA